MLRYWVLLTVVGFILAGVVGFCMWWVYGRLLVAGQYRFRGRGASPSRRRPLRIMPNFLRRISSKASISSDEEIGRKSEGYFD